MTHRTVQEVRAAVREDVGALHTHRALPDDLRAHTDPFLLLGHHGPQDFAPNNTGLPFGPHPHRGFETVTFVRAGSLAHHDTGGHASIVEAGGVQWMTAGSGLIHAEVSPPSFKRDGGPLEILQLWVNLPARLKMTAPRYFGLGPGAIPQTPLDEGRASLSLVSGRMAGVEGPIASLTDVVLSSVELDAGAHIVLPAPRDRTVLFYVIAGEVAAGGHALGARDLVTFAQDGDTIEVLATDRAAILYGHAQPLREPVVQRGPFVMSSEPEIAQAFEDLRAGKFGGAPIALEVD